jgi:FtsH-binding integral membrane protein
MQFHAALLHYVCIMMCVCFVTGFASVTGGLHVPFRTVRDTLRLQGGAKVEYKPFDVPSSWKRNSGEQSINYTPRTKYDFATRESRLGFIRKVFAIFGTQMLTTMAVTCLIMTHTGLRGYLLENHQTISLGSGLLSLAVVVPLVGSAQLRHSKPWNFVFLGLFTLLQSVAVGTFSTTMSTRSVCLGTVHTLAAVLGTALYTLQPNPKFDITTWGTGLLTTLITFLVGTILSAVFDMPLNNNLLSGAMAVLFATYLFHDMQKVVGGRHHKHQYGESEYILAALNLYQDAIGLYMEIVRFLREREKEKEREDRNFR